MNDIQPIGQSGIETKIKEAETCHSMGMMQDALQVYEQILASLPGRDGQTRETVVARINLLKKDMEDQEKAENKGFSQEDISIFKKTLSSLDDVPTLLDGAAALKELGLMEEAIVEYEKLVEPPRNVPLIGMAELHKTIYRCKVEAVSDQGKSVRRTLYVAKSHFHMLDID